MIAAVLTFVGGVSLYLDRTVFDSDAFADRATTALEDPDVRAFISERVTDQAVKARPDLVGVRPVIGAVADGIIRSTPFRALFRAGATDLHRSVFTRDSTTVSLAVSDVGVLVIQALERISPAAAKRVPPNLETQLVRISDGSEQALTQALQLAEGIHFLAVACLILAALLLVAGVLLAPDRRRVFGWIGLGAVGAGLATVLLFTVAGLLVTHAAEDGQPRDAARAVWDVYLGDLRDWGVLVAVVGAVVAGASASLVRPMETGPMLRAGWATGERHAEPPAAAGGPRAGPDRGGRPGDRRPGLDPPAADSPCGHRPDVRGRGRGDADARATRARSARSPSTPPLPRSAACGGCGPGPAGARRGHLHRPCAAERGRDGHRHRLQRPPRAVRPPRSTRSPSSARTTRWRRPTASPAGCSPPRTRDRRQLDDGVRALLIDTHYGFTTDARRRDRPRAPAPRAGRRSTREVGRALRSRPPSGCARGSATRTAASARSSSATRSARSARRRSPGAGRRAPLPRRAPRGGADPLDRGRRRVPRTRPRSRDSGLIREVYRGPRSRAGRRCAS